MSTLFETRPRTEVDQYMIECTDPRAWAHQDANQCGCKGSGWWLDAMDGWHQCPLHEGDHPEADPDDSIPLAGVAPATGPYLLKTEVDPEDIPF